VDADGARRGDLVLSPEVAAPAWRLAPKAFTEIVEAKGTIAEHLRDRVGEILDVRATDDGWRRLGKRCTSRCWCRSRPPTRPTPSSACGRVASPFGQPYETGDADGFDALAAYYGVSAEAVAVALADLVGILADVTVRYASGDYRVTATDTLATVARHFDVDVAALPAGLSVVDGGRGLFAAATPIDRSAMTRALADGDTFALLGAFFGADPGRVGSNTQDVRGCWSKVPRSLSPASRTRSAATTRCGSWRGTSRSTRPPSSRARTCSTSLGC
jgi:hypothetical protein